ncbi:type II toxin-antitoxin system TacA family antitoxin [Edwardsiella piscicida]|uniref:DUF1778 domain-containing protein n=2 Tax=Edwardsiella piscicida TaxID=1263550 RepID=A0AAQ3C0H1_EDWPI|nr:DUF1778 domain-containing protein [Edwardsiella piscicida]MDM3866544.1 DUF1778 domain-containing protein [Edwardsiella piscicida]QHR95298.1 DUF1778 domain-containing protein [Edwardsiella piscicida]UJT82122.1 DUF1778 domain-containing protein [Edwardsiella piscicida]UJT85390.1 DUF1778 domain-containing protein [Edwardsiella piscicida]WCF11953.1 DUF1778 domain-containing protein [Edwardsiella piscicida]
MATARLDLRLDPEIKAKAEKASALLGLKTLTEYIVHIVDNDAKRVIAAHESMALPNDIFDQFMNACEQAKEPNSALKSALSFTREKGIK